MEIWEYLPESIRDMVRGAKEEGLEEIRLRLGQPVELFMGDKAVRNGPLVETAFMEETLNYLTEYSWCSFEEQLRQGFFTIEGGHRVGVAGHCSYLDNNCVREVNSLSDINAINIRVAHERIGCSKALMKYVRRENGIYNTMLVSGPGVGKTTYLRDLIRIISDGGDGCGSLRVGVVDERSEIGASHGGRPQNNLGSRTDVMDNCPKLLGMRMLLRSMSPQVIAVDELDGKAECHEIWEMINSGVKLLCTVHGESLEELRNRENIWPLISSGIFERIFFLERREGGGRVVKAYGKSGDSWRCVGTLI